MALTYRLTPDQNLRLSATQTLSRPEYREMAPIAYFEQVGLATTVGNPDLQRALIQNYDLRWEWFPRAGEVLSFGVFAKHFTDPIEKVIIQSTGTNMLSFVNAGARAQLRGRGRGAEAVSGSWPAGWSRSTSSPTPP